MHQIYFDRLGSFYIEQATLSAGYEEIKLPSLKLKLRCGEPQKTKKEKVTRKKEKVGRKSFWCNMSSSPIPCSTRFMHRHADAELASLIQSTVPPADVNKVSMFQSHLEKYRQQDWVFVKWVAWIVPIPLHPTLVVPIGASRKRSTKSTKPQSLPTSWMRMQHEPTASHSQILSLHPKKLVRLLRLNAALLATTWSQTELQIEQDLSKMRTWAASFHLFASQQAFPYRL